jgi:hypothetical protein
MGKVTDPNEKVNGKLKPKAMAKGSGTLGRIIPEP